MKPILLKIGVLAQKNNKLLLIKEKNANNGLYYWNIIKGTFEPKKDVDLLACAQRECLEEAGVKIQLKKIVSVFNYERPRHINIQINFLADIINNKGIWSNLPKRPIKGEQIIHKEFFSKRDLKKLKKSELMNERSCAAVEDWQNITTSNTIRMKIFN